MKHILVGYDETPPAERALERAAELAKKFEAEVTVASIAGVLHGVVAGAVADPPAVHAQQLQHARDKLAELGVEIETGTGVGDPATAAVAIAAERKADMIIVGTHGRPGLGRLLLGSVSDDVEHKAHCDVLIVH